MRVKKSHEREQKNTRPNFECLSPSPLFAGRLLLQCKSLLHLLNPHFSPFAIAGDRFTSLQPRQKRLARERSPRSRRWPGCTPLRPPHSPRNATKSSPSFFPQKIFTPISRPFHDSFPSLRGDERAASKTGSAHARVCVRREESCITRKGRRIRNAMNGAEEREEARPNDAQMSFHLWTIKNVWPF